MRVLALVLGNSSTRLWGLTSHERLRRQLKEVGDIKLCGGAEEIDRSSKVLLLSSEFLFETRTIRGLLEHENSVLVDLDGMPAAAYVDGHLISEASRCINKKENEIAVSLFTRSVSDLVAFNEALRTANEPLLERVTSERKSMLENRLYGNAYRGITDLVTKFVWPRPARTVVHWCAQLGLSPNMVTSVGFALVIAASILFLKGHYLSGLVAAWIMTFLDTVDGKLARVTIQSSKLGHVFDHGMDIIHPPFWYIFWGMSLVSFQPWLGLDQVALYWVIVISYLVGRVVEGVFPVLGLCTIFTWRPFDAWFRLITARRNPCLIILTVAALFKQPELGFIGVVAWSAFTSLVLMLRLAQGMLSRLINGPLDSWLSDSDAAGNQHVVSHRVFSSTRGAYGRD